MKTARLSPSAVLNLSGLVFRVHGKPQSTYHCTEHAKAVHSLGLPCASTASQQEMLLCCEGAGVGLPVPSIYIYMYKTIYIYVYDIPTRTFCGFLAIRRRFFG